MLSIKGREPFIRMQLWLSDVNNIDKLQTLKNERREANKRRRTHLDEGRGTSTSARDNNSPLYNFNSNSSGFSPLSSGQSPFPSSGNNSGYHASNNNNNSAKKPRILFSDEQKEALRLAFSMDSYPTQSTIEFLAVELGLSSRTITNWFHNHRMRLKQLPHSGASSDPDSSPAVGSLPFGLNRDGVTFDIVQFRLMLAQRLSDSQARNRSGGNHSDKVSKFHGLFGSTIPGLASQMYGNPNSCSSPGSSSQGDDEYQRGTLDLSMTSSQPLKKISPGSNRSLAGDSDRSRDSFDDDQDSNHSPLPLRPSSPPPAQAAPVVKTGSSRRKPAFVTSSSSRRKPAQPQWVAPGLHDFSGDEDEEMSRNHDDLSDSEMDSGIARREALINGVCVRQSPSDKKNFAVDEENSRSDDDWDEDDRQSIEGRPEPIQT
jgi:homeobox protein cut-like